MATDDAFFDPTRTSTQRSLLFLAAGALLGLATAGYALFTAKGTRLGGVPAEAVALVNQRPILRSDFMTQTAGQYSIPFAETSREQRENTLQSMIDEELLMQRGLEIDLPSYDPDVRNALVAGVELEVIAEVIAQQPTEAELQAYYQTHRSDYASEGVIQLRDLVVRSDAVHSRAALRAIAGDAAAEMREGQPLEAVMKRHGLVDSGRFLAGDISDPVDEPDGVHVVAMLKHRLAVPQTYEQAGNRVWNDFKHAARGRVSAANLAYLHSRADIVVAADYAR